MSRLKAKKKLIGLLARERLHCAERKKGKTKKKKNKEKKRKKRRKEENRSGLFSSIIFLPPALGI